MAEGAPGRGALPQFWETFWEIRPSSAWRSRSEVGRPSRAFAVMKAPRVSRNRRRARKAIAHPGYGLGPWTRTATDLYLLARHASNARSGPPRGSASWPPSGLGRRARSDGAVQQCASGLKLNAPAAMLGRMRLPARGGAVRRCALRPGPELLLGSVDVGYHGRWAASLVSKCHRLGYRRLAARRMLCDRNALSAVGALARLRPAAARWSCCPRTGCAAENGCTRPSRACRSGAARWRA